ncbi:MAG: DUF177 domain-containing protein [Calditrichaeota bacterium]|nr:MAG: DUF177 domain-containing protein [Calditrichota bacterium]
MKINVKNLKKGIHSFDFITNQVELDLAGNENYVNDIHIHSEIDKRENDIFVTTKFNTLGQFVCDRCLTNFERIVEEQFTLIYTTRKDMISEEEEDIIQLDTVTYEIDLCRDVRDNLLLSKPMKVLCSEACKGLCPRCGANLNYETCNCNSFVMDPRWEALRKLL